MEIYPLKQRQKREKQFFPNEFGYAIVATLFILIMIYCSHLHHIYIYLFIEMPNSIGLTVHTLKKKGTILHKKEKVETDEYIETICRGKHNERKES